MGFARSSFSFLLVAGFGCSEGFRVDRPVDADVDATKLAFTVVQEMPDAGALNAVWGAASDDIHAVGDDGVTLHYDGLKWNPLFGTTGAKLNALWGSSAHDVYAVGVLAANGRGTIQHFDGIGWTEETVVPYGLFGVWGVNDVRYAVGFNGKVYSKSATNPKWTILTSLPQNPNAITTLYTPWLWGISGNSPSMILIAGDSLTTYNYNGTRWLPISDPHPESMRVFRSVWGPPSDTPFLYVGANFYGVWLYHGIDTLTSTLNEEVDLPERADQYIWGIWGTAVDRVVFVGDGGRIMTYNGGPDAMKRVASPTARNLMSVWGSSLEDVWIVGDGATILHGTPPF